MAIFQKSNFHTIASLAFSWTIISLIMIHNADAQTNPPTFVELFTSQGCSSCPPADKILGELTGRKDVIALTFPVDYWDYLGWKDTLASSANTKRQYAYAKARRDRQVYTPQMVLNGRHHVIGNRRAQVFGKIRELSRAKNTAYVQVKIKSRKDTITVTTGAPPSKIANKKATLWLIMFNKKVTIPIKHGENSGRTISYYNVVRQMLPLGKWTGKSMKVTLPKAELIAQGYDGCIALLQVNNSGPVLGVAALNDWQISQ